MNRTIAWLSWPYKSVTGKLDVNVGVQIPPRLRVREVRRVGTSTDWERKTLVLYRKRADEKSVGRREGDNGALSIKPFERGRVTTLWDLYHVSRGGWEGGGCERVQA